MDFSKLFVVKYGSKGFEAGTVVRYDNIINNNLFLVEDFADSEKREWIMNFDLYPFLPKKGFYYDEKFQAIADAFMQQQKSVC